MYGRGGYSDLHAQRTMGPIDKNCARALVTERATLSPGHLRRGHVRGDHPRHHRLRRRHPHGHGGDGDGVHARRHEPVRALLRRRADVPGRRLPRQAPGLGAPGPPLALWICVCGPAVCMDTRLLASARLRLCHSLSLSLSGKPAPSSAGMESPAACRIQARTPAASDPARCGADCPGSTRPPRRCGGGGSRIQGP